VIVEDISAKTQKGKRRWNASFSPLEVGKRWFYSEVEKNWILHKKQGFETYEHRKAMGYKKWRNKNSDNWESHNVDSHSLCEMVIGNTLPTDKRIMGIKFLEYHRRQLHRLEPALGGSRRRYGGTRSLGFTRGSLVKHEKYGLCHVGGYQSSGQKTVSITSPMESNMKNRISLHRVGDMKRLTQSARVEDCRFLTYSTWSFTLQQ